MQRYSHGKVAPAGVQAMLGLERYLHECGLEESLLHLIKLRASHQRMRLLSRHALERSQINRRAGPPAL